MDVVATRNLGKRFGATTAVDDVDLRVPEGSVFALLGPNGSGKTSVIHMLAGLISPTTGSIELFGAAPAEHDTDVRNRIGVVHEDVGLYDTLTGREHIAYLSGGNDRDIDPMDVLHLVDLADAADQRVGEYSGGMAKRLALAIALSGDPSLLLLDEPFVALDVETAAIVEDLILDRSTSGTTVVFSTHMFEHVERLADRAALLSNGHLVAEGPVTELCDGRARVLVTGDSPATEWVDTLERIPGVDGIVVRDGGTIAVIRGTMTGCLEALDTLENGTFKPRTLHLAHPALTNVAEDAPEAGQ